MKKKDDYEWIHHTHLVIWQKSTSRKGELVSSHLAEKYVKKKETVFGHLAEKCAKKETVVFGHLDEKYDKLGK